jgi:hypothetical protein
MRPKLILGLIGPCLFLAGCRLAGDITDNLVFNTCLFCDECQAKSYYRHLAAVAWADFQTDNPEHADSVDFANGFKQSFADYLDAGEDYCLPSLPPQKYWKTRYQNPEGRSAIELWFAGFRAGVAAAKASGYRDFVVIPIANEVPQPPDSLATMPGAPVPVLPLPASAPAAPIGKPGPAPIKAAPFPSGQDVSARAEEQNLSRPTARGLASPKEIPIPRTGALLQEDRGECPKVSPKDKQAPNDRPRPEGA